MSEIWKGLIIGAATVIFATIGVYYQQLEINKLDVLTDFDVSYFSKPKFPNDEIVLTVNNVEKNKLGILRVALFNYSSQELTDIPINIKVTPKTQSGFKLLSYSAVGGQSIPDLVKEVKAMVFDGQSYYFSYIVSSINRTEKEDYGFQLRVLFEGDEEPMVSVVPKGIGVRAFDIQNSPSQKEANVEAVFVTLISLVIIVVAAFLFGFIIVTPVLSLSFRKLEYKSFQKHAKDLIDSIESGNLLPDKSDEEVRLFVADMMFNKRSTWWKSLSFLGKLSLGMIEPKREDHLFISSSEPTPTPQTKNNHQDPQ
jgi:hypothetical protein